MQPMIIELPITPATRRRRSASRDTAGRTAILLKRADRICYAIKSDGEPFHTAADSMRRLILGAVLWVLSFNVSALMARDSPKVDITDQQAVEAAMEVEHDIFSGETTMRAPIIDLRSKQNERDETVRAIAILSPKSSLIGLVFRVESMARTRYERAAANGRELTVGEVSTELVWCSARYSNCLQRAHATIFIDGQNDLLSPNQNLNIRFYGDDGSTKDITISAAYMRASASAYQRIKGESLGPKNPADDDLGSLIDRHPR